MGKIVMPKNSALLNEIEAVLKIYYEEGDWLANEVYRERLKALIGPDQYHSSYTKKAQITSYFGFTIWEDINNAQSRRRITSSGRKMYEALEKSDQVAVQSILMESLETVKFGRDNYGCPESNSDVEPPSLFIRASLDLGYLTYREFAYLLWKLEDIGGNYTDAIAEIREYRSKGYIELGEEAKKYTDCKPIMILERWGFLCDESGEGNEKHIVVAPEVHKKYEKRLKNLSIYNVDMNCEKVDEERVIGAETDKDGRLQGGENRIFYGVPGAGKSYEVDRRISDETTVERVVFHPDYTYADFVGQILPSVEKTEQNPEGKLKYTFSPGPLTKSIDRAEKDPEHMYYLVIEEINRGNAPAIFGDVFQLLDREENGGGKYPISNYEIADYVYKDMNHPIVMPSNLTVYATMNTSDQNVFTLDTAFQRRWMMEHVKNDVKGAIHSAEKIERSDITWGAFASVVNDQIIDYHLDLGSSEDKRLGAYFARGKDLSISIFSEKVLKYLWDDAFKFKKDEIFDPKLHSLDELIELYKTASGDPLKSVLRIEIYDRMISEVISKDNKTDDQ